MPVGSPRAVSKPIATTKNFGLNCFIFAIAFKTVLMYSSFDIISGKTKFILKPFPSSSPFSSANPEKKDMQNSDVRV